MIIKKPIQATLIIYCLITIIWAYQYITSNLSLNDLKSYEAEWQFQLLMFLIYRFSWITAITVIVLFFEIKLLRIKNN
jgi:hypothetical protein